MRLPTVLLVLVLTGGIGAQIATWGAWNATIPVDFDTNLPSINRETFKFVTTYFEERTCLRFPYDDNTTQPRLYINAEKGGSAKIGPPGWLNMGPVDFGTKGTFHELMHVLGFIHSEQRPDQDLYIKANISKDEYGHEWIKRYVPFDFGSSMMGPSYVSRDPKYDSSMRGQLASFYDVLAINVDNKCFDRCKESPKPACQNGGSTNPNTCTACICPRGWAGTLCDQRSPGNADVDCGRTITVTDQVQTVEMPVKGKGEKASTRDHTHCYYLFEAPACKRIQVTMRDLTNDCGWECQYIGLEIYGNVDKRQTGYRYCCQNQLNQTITNDYNKLVIDAYSWGEALTYTFKIDVVAV